MRHALELDHIGLPVSWSWTSLSLFSLHITKQEDKFLYRSRHHQGVTCNGSLQVCRRGTQSQQMVLDPVGQRLPARLEDVRRHSDCVPAFFSVTVLDEYAHGSRRTFARVEHAYLV